ncbi:MAG: RagB/SusD family nutrient uptake outer membrane protein [Gemmatimonas sp.]|nr:RagB/SusD family nutrient uptake outer membrane protein [Gemmatimonas sp.]
MIFQEWQGQRRGRAATAGIVLLSLGGFTACDSLLEADLPHVLTDAAIEAPGTAETQVNSAIALFECGYSALGVTALGHEDVMESIAGAAQQHQFDQTPNLGNCDPTSASTAWLDPVMGARSRISTDPAKLVSTAEGEANGVYDRINGEWALGADGERLSAIASIYMAMSLTHLGEFVCEASFDGSDLVTPTELLNLADDWITSRALVHIDEFGDFTMPFGIAPSARGMALAVRSRIRWANRDLEGVAADAAEVLGGNPTFTAWITRETGETRRNKIYHSVTAVGYSGGLGINDWWNPSIRRANPVTGEPWPDPIPFTGYLFLGIMPDGRALEAGNLPVRWAEEERDDARQPIPLNNGAVPDTRVQHIFKSIQGPAPREVPDRYGAEDDDIPYMSWEELRLIQADYNLSQGNLESAIDHVNSLRVGHGLPEVSGAYRTSLAGNAEAVRSLLLEERRREFYAEGGRYWSTKIQNTDVLWFPRNEGETPFQGYALEGGVRQRFGEDEYTANPYFIERGGLDARGTGCTDLFGAQAPVIF